MNIKSKRSVIDVSSLNEKETGIQKLKVFFGCSVRGERKEETIKLFQKTLETMEKLLPIEVISKHNFLGITGETEMTETEIWQRDFSEWQIADLGIFEISGPSFGVGFEACYFQFTLEVPIMFLAHESIEKVSAMIMGNPAIKNEDAWYEKYNEKNLQYIIWSFLSEKYDELKTPYWKIFKPEFDPHDLMEKDLAEIEMKKEDYDFFPTYVSPAGLDFKAITFRADEDQIIEIDPTGEIVVTQVDMGKLKRDAARYGSNDPFY